MITATSTYGIGTTVTIDAARAVERVKDALAAEGFGVLCEIDVSATLKKKLGVDFRPYVILGACNPELAHQALTAERDIGLLLPCNVIVYADDAQGRTVIAAIDPVAALEVSHNENLRPLAEDAKARLNRALLTVESASSETENRRSC